MRERGERMGWKNGIHLHIADGKKIFLDERTLSEA